LLLRVVGKWSGGGFDQGMGFLEHGS
jgi:hypothetical protein